MILTILDREFLIDLDEYKIRYYYLKRLMVIT